MPWYLASEVGQRYRDLKLAALHLHLPFDVIYARNLWKLHAFYVRVTVFFVKVRDGISIRLSGSIVKFS